MKSQSPLDLRLDQIHMCDQFLENVPERAKTTIEIQLKVGVNFIFNKYLKPIFS